MEGERWQVLGCLYLSTYTFEVKTLGWEIESVKRQPLLHRKKSLLDYDVRRIRFRSFSRYTSAHSTT